MGRNLVICCDGTANEFGPKNSNVVHLYSVLQRSTNDQLAFYDPGVGTFSPNPAVTGTARFLWRLVGLGLGLGLTQNVLDAYTFIMQNYQEGDRIFLFGFSRGAYTAGAVAGLLHKCGLLGRDNHNLLPYAMRIYKRVDNAEIAKSFKATFARDCRIYLLGLWDTVSSVGWVWDPAKFPHSTNNPDVDHVRHAVAIDERRAFYRQNLFGKGSDAADASVKQVWFAGAHTDVGGSHPEQGSGLAKLALEWMIVESMRLGLRVDLEKAKEVVLAAPPPSHEAPIFKSLKWYWWPAEFFPKLVNVRKADRTWGRKPRLNLGRPRGLKEDAIVHQSVLDRLAGKVDGYSPRNLPRSARNVEPRVSLKDL